MISEALRFGFQVGPVNISDGDQRMYREVVEDAKLGEALGYDSVWMLEHHFSYYYPTPSPLTFLSHIAAHCPKLSLGTAVLVLPWYQPLRVASELAMLTLLTDRDLHVGIGRGTAPMEYDAFDMDMADARQRFEESLEIVRRLLAGEKVEFSGKFYNVRRPVKIIPQPARQPIFYGAIGSPSSADKMATLGLPPLCISNFPDKFLRQIQENWTAKATELGMATNVTRPLYIKCYIADSLAEAREEARRSLPKTFQMQIDHYETDKYVFGGSAGYEDFEKFFNNLRKLVDPGKLDPYLDFQLIGTVDMVAERIEQLRAMGFNYIVVQSASIGVPQAQRHKHLRRFAEEVMPRFQGTSTMPLERLAS